MRNEASFVIFRIAGGVGAGLLHQEDAFFEFAGLGRLRGSFVCEGVLGAVRVQGFGVVHGIER